MRLFVLLFSLLFIPAFAVAQEEGGGRGIGHTISGNEA